MVVAAGADIVDVSAGQTVPEGKPVYGRQFQTPFSDRIRHEARVPTMTRGNISSAADVNTILAAGRADLVVLARAHLGPLLEPPCGSRSGLHAAVATDVRVAESVQGKDEIGRRGRRGREDAEDGEDAGQVSMSGNYIQCSECGKRALRIATRCPQCGHEFVSVTPDEPRPLVDPEHHPAILAAAATVLLALALGVGWWARRPHVEHESTAALIRPDTTSVVRLGHGAGACGAEPAPAGFARTWTKVHTGRSTGSEVTAILPVLTVVVDLFQRGWSRVALEGEVLGYVRQSTLQTQPLSSTPP